MFGCQSNREAVRDIIFGILPLFNVCVFAGACFALIVHNRVEQIAMTELLNDNIYDFPWTLVIIRVSHIEEDRSGKMAALKKIQDKPYNGFTELKKGFHLIHRFRAVKNKYAKDEDESDKSILAVLEDQVIFLPKHIGQRVTEKDLDELNASKEAIFLYFGGQSKHSK